MSHSLVDDYQHLASTMNTEVADSCETLIAMEQTVTSQKTSLIIIIAMEMSLHLSSLCIYTSWKRDMLVIFTDPHFDRISCLSSVTLPTPVQAFS
jgi:hypothetical protein